MFMSVNTSLTVQSNMYNFRNHTCCIFCDKGDSVRNATINLGTNWEFNLNVLKLNM